LPFDEDTIAVGSDIDDTNDDAEFPDATEVEAVAKRRSDRADTSILLPMHQNKHIEISKFEKALATFVDLTGVSREDWASLREILFLIRDKDGELPPMIEQLPKQVSTLRDRMRKRMPMMNMREADIPLNVLKLPTLPPNLQPEERERLEGIRALNDAKTAANAATRYAIKITKEKGKFSTPARQAQKEAADAKAQMLALREKNPQSDIDISNVPVVHMKLNFFDPPTLFKNIAASEISKRVHSGPGLIVDEPTELYHSHAWLSSVRSTSGRFAHVIIDGKKGPAIFPSDWVYYWCNDTMACPLQCHNVDEEDDNITDIHIGRIYGVGYDHRLKSCTEGLSLNGEPVLALQVQEALRTTHSYLATAELDPAQTSDELVLSPEVICIQETNVFAIEPVYVDICFGEEHSDAG
jgi:hypothetical protein